MQYLDLRDTRAVITVEDVQGMNMLQCFGGIFDSKDDHYYVQKMLDISFELKTYHLIFRNEFGESRSDLWNYTNLKRFVPCDPKIRTIQFEDCDDFTHILPKDHTCLNVYENNHWICLCDALSYNTSSSLRKIYIYDCQQLESLFCLSDSCSFCTKIHNLEVLELFSLASLTIVCKDAVDVRQSLSPSDLFSNLKEFSISYCHLIEKVLTPQIIRQLQYLETMYVRYCNSLNEIFTVTNGDDDDSSNISLPRLTKLNLNNLPNLKIVHKGSTPCGIFLSEIFVYI
jgi:sentrin-specific protease 7